MDGWMDPEDTQPSLLTVKSSPMRLVLHKLQRFLAHLHKTFTENKEMVKNKKNYIENVTFK